MSFLSLGVRNPFRHKLRTIFIIFMLTMGLLCVITSVSVSQFTTQQIGNMIGSGDADLVIYGENITLQDVNKIQSTENVTGAVGTATYMIASGNETLLLKASTQKVQEGLNLGIGNIQTLNGVLTLNEGDEIVLTEEMAEGLNKHVGDSLKVDAINIMPLPTSKVQAQPQRVMKDFKIRGIIRDITGMHGLISLVSANQYCKVDKNHFDQINVKVKPNMAGKVENILKASYPYITRPAALPNFLEKLFFYITLFIILVGGLIIMISTLKSVGERTREIGVLKAIGWSNWRVMSLILLESLVILLLSWVLTFLILAVVGYYLSQNFEVNLLVALKENIGLVWYVSCVSFIASLFIPLLGCLLPLLRVARLKPTEALKYE